MRLIVGLGNPGIQYSKTKHNVGFILLDAYAERNNLTWRTEKKFDAEYVKADDYVLAKPLTYMNHSGKAVASISKYFNIPTDEIVVIHDDVDFPELEVHVQTGRSSAGHKGVQSIIDSLGTNEFRRIRVGVGRPDNPNIDIEDWVLTGLSDEYINALLEEFDFDII